MLLEFVSAPAPCTLHRPRALHHASTCYVLSLLRFRCRASIPSRVYICTALYYCQHQAVNNVARGGIGVDRTVVLRTSASRQKEYVA